MLLRRITARPVLAALVGLVTLLLPAAGATAAPGPLDVVGRVIRAEDGRPLAGVRVVLTGSGVGVTTTDVNGRYRLSPPPGTHDLVVDTGDPCLVPPRARSVVVPEHGIFDVRADVRVVSRTDRFGYGCSPSAARWVDTGGGTLAIPNEGAAELHLPFAFPYYGRTYREVTVHGPGLLGIGPRPQLVSVGAPVPIPSPGSTDGAISALAGPLNVDEGSPYSYRLDEHRLVLTFAGLTLPGTGRPVTVQVQLTDDGTIDLVYGDLAAVDRSSPVLIGIESPDGTDGFTFAHRELPALSGTAWRLRPVATAAVAGVVRNANDGLPVAGATVTADPGGRAAATDAGGRYHLAVIPGRYAITGTALGHGSAGATVDARTPPTVRAPVLTLPAPDARLDLDDPEAGGLDLTTGIGGLAAGGLTLANDGDRPLQWALYERDATPDPAVPPAYEPTVAPGARRVALGRVATDPANGFGRGDDLLGLDAGSNGEALRFRVVLSATSTLHLSTVAVWLDVDHDPATGRTETFGRTGQPIPLGLGAEYVVWITGPPATTGTLARADTYDRVASVPVLVDGPAFTVELPIVELPAMVPGEAARGPVGVVVDVSERHGTIVDRMPDTGAASVVAALDAPWLFTGPSGGVLAPGGTIRLSVSAGQWPDAGDHRAELRLETDDPRRPTRRVPVTVHVRPPAA